MIPATCLTTCEDEDGQDNTRVALILGDKPVCGMKALLMAPKIKLSSGYEMPVIGFGTYGVSNRRGGDQLDFLNSWILLQLNGYQCASAIHVAIETGFRHFDTAFCYENEKEVGEAIRTQIQMGNVSRENIFLTTKVCSHIPLSISVFTLSSLQLWNTHHDPRDVRRICEQQLEDLGFDYIDLYLMHFPVGYKHLCDEILYPTEDDKIQTKFVRSQL